MKFEKLPWKRDAGMITMHPAALFKTGNGEVKCTVDMMTRPRGSTMEWKPLWTMKKIRHVLFFDNLYLQDKDYMLIIRHCDDFIPYPPVWTFSLTGTSSRTQGPRQIHLISKDQGIFHWLEVSKKTFETFWIDSFSKKHLEDPGSRSPLAFEPTFFKSDHVCGPEMKPRGLYHYTHEGRPNIEFYQASRWYASTAERMMWTILLAGVVYLILWITGNLPKHDLSSREKKDNRVLSSHDRVQVLDTDDIPDDNDPAWGNFFDKIYGENKLKSQDLKTALSIQEQKEARREKQTTTKRRHVIQYSELAEAVPEDLTSAAFQSSWDKYQ